MKLIGRPIICRLLTMTDSLLKAQMSSLQSQETLRESFLAGVKSVQPQKLIKKWLRREGQVLWVGNKTYPLGKTYIVGFGKAVAGMVPHIEKILQNGNESFIEEGIISVPFGFHSSSASDNLRHSFHSRVQFYDGARFNLPDDASLQTTLKIKGLVESLSENDLLIVLISGGGSALLCLPEPPLTLEEKTQVIRTMSSSGASITELNAVRKVMSGVKGGKLALMSKARVVSFILSDIVNSPVHMIASGPTVLQGDSCHSPTEILKKYGVTMTQNLREALNVKRTEITASELKRVTNLIIGENVTALAAAAEYFENRGEVMGLILSSNLEGDAAARGKELATLAYSVLKSLKDESYRVRMSDVPSGCVSDHTLQELEDVMKKARRRNGPSLPVVLVLGGETTVKVKGQGRGGRNQEMVLSASLQLEKLCSNDSVPGEISFLSGGTDGIDGPTDAAGAVTFYSNFNGDIRSQTSEARKQNLAPEKFLEDNNSYEYFSTLSDGKYLITTGHTGTNVMDIQLLWIQSYS